MNIVNKSTITKILVLLHIACLNGVAMEILPMVGDDLPVIMQQINHLKKLGAWYDPEPTSDAPLTEDKITNSDFWQKIKINKLNQGGNLSVQDKKDIEQVCDYSNYGYGDYLHHVRRYNVAAALLFDFPEQHSLIKRSLCDFVFKDDYAIVEFMLGMGANPNSLGLMRNTAIFNATTIKMAKLLHNYGASIDAISPHDGGTLLHNIFNLGRPSELIGFYVRHGVSPFLKNWNGEDVLEYVLVSLFTNKQKLTYLVHMLLDNGITEQDILKTSEKYEQKIHLVIKAIELHKAKV